MSQFKVTKDRRAILNGTEIENCLGFQILADAGRDPEVVIRVSVDEISIDGYTDIFKQKE